MKILNGKIFRANFIWFQKLSHKNTIKINFLRKNVRVSKNTQWNYRKKSFLRMQQKAPGGGFQKHQEGPNKINSFKLPGHFVKVSNFSNSECNWTFYQHIVSNNNLKVSAVVLIHINLYFSFFSYLSHVLCSTKTWRRRNQIFSSEIGVETLILWCS